MNVMKHETISTENYLLIVDDSEIKKGDWMYNILLDVISNITDRGVITDNLLAEIKRFKERFKKIIAHLPLNGAPVLEGVDLLPPLEDDIENLEIEYFKELEERREIAKKFTGQVAGRHPDAFGHSEMMHMNRGYIEGYNKAKEKYKFTEDDMMEAMLQILEYYVNNFNKDVDGHKKSLDIIQSLQQPKMPVGFECEVEIKCWCMKPENGGCVKCNQKPKTTTNSQGQTVWVVKYIFND